MSLADADAPDAPAASNGGDQHEERKEGAKTEAEEGEVKKEEQVENVQKDNSREEKAKKGLVDRERVCPFLLRVFCCTSRHHNLADYNRGKQAKLALISAHESIS